MEPSEILALFHGYLWRQRRELETVAWQTLHIVNAIRGLSMSKRRPKMLNMQDLLPWYKG